MTWRIDQGDCRELLRAMPEESVTASLSDPPYGLSFMGKDWDHGVPGVAYWAEVLRVLKPGAVLMAFGGTRTHHRLMVAIEDAGFEIFDCMMWVTGQGFPKSHDISKAIDKAAGAERKKLGLSPNRRASHERGDSWKQTSPDSMNYQITAPATPDAATWEGYGTSLKPSWEIVILARKPRCATYAATAVEHGSGALWIDGGRVAIEGLIDPNRKRYNQPGSGLPDGEKNRSAIYEGGWSGDYKGATQPHADSPRHDRRGRWPANLLLSHSSGCVRRGERRVKVHWSQPIRTRGTGSDIYGNGKGYNAGFLEVGQPIGYADADGFETIADFDCVPECAVRLLGEQSGERKSGAWNGHRNEPKTADIFGQFSLHDEKPTQASSGTAARFFKNFDPPLRFVYSAKSSRRERDAGLPSGERSHHPCVKPLAVTRYLATLLRPPESYLDDATLLVPFAGSGSEMIGALLAGWRNIVGIELEQEYVDIAEARLAWWSKAMELTGKIEPKAILAAMRKMKPTPLFNHTRG